MVSYFLAAQDPIYPIVLAELRAGQKRSHWMWFIFPQLRALGRSDMAKRFGLTDLAEARAYLAHHTLGPRLRECTALVLAHPEKSVHAIFGSPDDQKFRSSMTLFARAAADENNPFRAALAVFYGGVEDALTLELLGVG
jgi:uncharacterized protein (DUF1810 family)